MKKLILLSILFSTNVAFAAADTSTTAFKVPDGLVCKGDPTSAGGMYCTDANPPVAVPPIAVPPLLVVDPVDPNINKPDPKMPQIKRRYEANLKKWQAKKLKNYTFTMQRSCFCLPEYTTPMFVTVQDGKVVSAVTESLIAVPVSPNGNEADPVMVDVTQRGMTVDQLFNEVKQSIDNNAASIDVKYDSTWGYPRSISIDLDKRMADEEFALISSSLKPIRKTIIKPLPRG